MVIQNGNRKGWFWYIPQHNNIVSVGVVAPFDYIFKGRTDYAQTYDEEVEMCPGVKERVANAKQGDGIFRDEGLLVSLDTSVAATGGCWSGDAFGFLDPLYSSGVLLALKSGELAAEAIVEGLAKGDTSAAQLGKWGRVVQRGR